ncbi:MAG TPA: TolC family protein [Candidatus Limnocylindrales bacterium]|nr:TolC family protein [Candidatus Limnocylindrales bacterium]
MPSIRPLLAAVLIGAIAGTPVTPVHAQEPATAPKPQTAAQGGVPISLGISKHDYTHARSAFPRFWLPYEMMPIAPGVLANAPRLEQLIHDGKLELSLQDAIALALENSMDIVVTRYNPWIADVSLLKTKAGGYGYGTPGSISVGSTANLPLLYYDPYVTYTMSVADVTTPINNVFLSGVGTGGGTSSVQAMGLTAHNAAYNTQYQQAFDTGTSFSVAWNNTRASSNALNFFNPYVQSSLTVSFQQQLLAGAGRFINRRNILIAQNNRKIADLAFTQQAITTTTNTINAYWELAYARQNVKVQQQAVTVAEKLYNDNKKQLEIGTMAPLDVTRAESELATDRTNLIVAQTTQLQDELLLKNYISKDPTASNLISVEVIPTDKPETPAAIEAASFEDALKEAFKKRPDVLEQFYNLKNANIDVRATKNALLPTATLGLQYVSSGLAGNSFTTGTPTVQLGTQMIDAAGNPVDVYLPETVAPVTGVRKDGFGTVQSQIFHNTFPLYAAQLSVSLPLRNRGAQADNIHAQLVERQFEAQVQQIKNNAVLDVRNTTIALQQGRAQVESARKARELQQQTFDAEQKKYQLGASTVYNVILTQRDLITAQGTELRALANLAEAKANYERALGRTLEVNNVTIADGKKGIFEQDTLIPGTLNGQVVGTDSLFKRLEKANLEGQR